MRLRNKVALITGAASGIGTVIAKYYMIEGAKVFGCALEESATIAESESFSYLRADVTNWESAQVMVAKCVERFGRLDILVNNAGVDQLGTIEDIDPATFERTYRINVLGLFHMCKAALPELKKVTGNIVNIASELGAHPCPNRIAYAPTKAANIFFTKCMAIDCGPLVRVNCITPGLTDTPMAKNRINSFADPEKFKEMIRRRSIMKRWCVPDDVAKGAVFLASDDACNITGHSLATCAGGDFYYCTD